MSDSAAKNRFTGKSDWFDDHYRTTTRGRVRLQLVLDRLEPRLPPPPGDGSSMRAAGRAPSPYRWPGWAMT
jgi:hypothetical protein